LLVGDHLFVGVGVGNGMSEVLAGAILLVLSLFFMIVCLLIMVKLLNSMLQGPMAKVIHKYINSDFPGFARHLTGYVAIAIGAGLTMLVQSSSVFTSAITPLVGINVITVERMYPLTLGANIGTTITGILTALTSDADRFHDSMQIAFCHLFFNVVGILLFYPLPFMRRFPLFLAKQLGKISERYRWFAVVYLIGAFFVIPGIILGLSIASIWALVGVGVPVLLVIIFAVVVNLSQNKCPQCLPSVLSNWDFLPEPLRSLEPYDHLISACCANSACRKACKCCYADEEHNLDESVDIVEKMPQENRVHPQTASHGACDNAAFESDGTFVVKF
jgi:sodium-dependent phosphate cotransporter